MNSHQSQRRAGDDVGVITAEGAQNARRQRAWEILSQLFLDTELSDVDIDAMARELRGTGFSMLELQHIYEHEVAPVCWHNLHVLPGGVWSGFDAAALQRAIEQHLARAPRWSPSWWQRLRVRRHTALTRGDWLRLSERLAESSAERLAGAPPPG